MFLRQKSWDKGEIFFGQDKVVGCGYLCERYYEKQMNKEEKQFA